jgi:hypothetical protein
MRKHIDLYVNEYSLALGADGSRCVWQLLDVASHLFLRLKPAVLKCLSDQLRIALNSGLLTYKRNRSFRNICFPELVFIFYNKSITARWLEMGINATIHPFPTPVNS